MLQLYFITIIWIIPDSSPCLSVNSHSNSENPACPSAIHLSYCPILGFIYSSIRIVNTYPHGKQLYQLDYSAHVYFFCPQFYKLHSFAKLLMLTTCPFHGVVSHTFVIRALPFLFCNGSFLFFFLNCILNSIVADETLEMSR